MYTVTDCTHETPESGGIDPHNRGLAKLQNPSSDKMMPKRFMVFGAVRGKPEVLGERAVLFLNKLFEHQNMESYGVLNIDGLISLDLHPRQYISEVPM